MMMTTRTDINIKDRLIHNQSPYPTKDKVLSYTIPVDHSETLLFCSTGSSILSSSSSNSSTSSIASSNGSSSSSTNSSQDNGSLSFITSDDDPCNGRDSLASFLDEGLGTSLDGVDEIASPIFPTLGRNDSGVFSSDEGTGSGGGSGCQPTISSTHSNQAGSLVAARPATIKLTSTSGSAAAAAAAVAEVVSSWNKPGNGTGGGTSIANGGSIVLSPSGATATISVVTDAVTGIPSIICTAAQPAPAAVSGGSSGGKGEKKAGKGHQAGRMKSMPLGGRQGPQKCTICDKVFSNASALTKHKLTHSDERRHACATCGKAFKRQDHLNGHMLTHRNKKPFECKSKGCGKSYCDARSLRRHVENRHGHEVLESMNLGGGSKSKGSHKESNGHHHHHHSHHQNEPQPEILHVAPVKVEPKEDQSTSPVQTIKTKSSTKNLDCMPVLQPEPQLQQPPQLEINQAQPRPECKKVCEKATLPPPVLHKMPENVATTLPIVIKRENTSVFDFDENMEDAAGAVPAPSLTFIPQQQPDKLLGGAPAAIKVSGILESGKIADIRLIQEWTKRLGDSKVALFLASGSAAANSIAQLADVSGQPVVSGAGLGGSHAFIPTTENGLFSITPISIVPTSSGEFAFKPTTLSSMPSGSSESPKPIYILPPEPLLSTGIMPSVAPVLSTVRKQEVNHQPSVTKASSKDVKSKSEKKGGGIGASLANRIKSKLKAGNMKKPGKDKASSGKMDNGQSPVVKPSISAASVVQLPQLQLSGGTISLGNPNGTGSGGGIISWCPIPTNGDVHSKEGALLESVEDDAAGDGEDKPVECSICCRRFKNTPALNGHMRLHGGYFKKETEGPTPPKKKESTKEHNTHTTPLQTASVSVRALIEEKIKERRNNLLKLAAAAAAEKAAAENPSSIAHADTNAPQQQLAPAKSKSSEKGAKGDNKIAQPLPQPQPQQQMIVPPPSPCIKVSMDGNTVKLKMEAQSSTSSLPEKDKLCDLHPNHYPHHQLLTMSSVNTSVSNSLISSSANCNGSVSNGNSTLPTPVSLDTGSFQDLSILIGGADGGSFGGEIGGNQSIIMTNPNSTTVHHHPQQPQEQQRVVHQVNNGGMLPVDKGNIALLDCGFSPEELCQAFHLIYVDGGMGAVTNGFENPNQMTLNGGNHQSTLKSVTEPIILQCPSQNSSAINNNDHDLPWEWRNSTSSSDTTQDMQDCVNSLLNCSTNSDATTPDESSTKDPVAGGGGFCYTPILSPNSSFCLTPGPDSPFEVVAPPNQSLSFMCPSPGMSCTGGSSYSSDPAINSLVNPPSSVEPIFSPDQAQTPQQSDHLQGSGVFNGFESQTKSSSIVSVSQMNSMPLSQQILAENGLDSCLPPINTFPSMHGSSFVGTPKDILLTATNNNNSLITIQQQLPTLGHNQQGGFLPFEMFSPFPLPKKIVEKWMSGKKEKGKGKIRVGGDYQADIPNFRGTKGRNKAYRCMDEKLWDPAILDLCSYEEVDKFLEFACCSAVPGGGMNKEYALHLLTFSKGNIREALLRLMEKLPALPAKLRSYSYAENQRWSSEEILAFQLALIQLGKDFGKLGKAIGTKSGKECACFYYFWKKVCPSEYQVMKQIWRDRLDHQPQNSNQQNQQSLSNNTTMINVTLASSNMNSNVVNFITTSNNNSNGNLMTNNNLSFLVPASEFRGK